MKRRIAFLLIANGLAACSAQGPHCLVSSDGDDVVGTWRYHGDRPSQAICRPSSVVFHTDGSFEATYEGCEFWIQVDLDRPSSSHVAGSWRAGDFCADRLFFPGVVVETKPRIPNTIEIVKLGDRLAIVGGASGLFDASYYRELPN